MSFLAGIARRAAETAADPSALQPKDRLLPRRFLGQRLADPEPEAAEEIAQPVRRQAAPLAREVTTEGTGWAEEDQETATTEGTPARRSPAAGPSPGLVRPERTLAPGEPPPEEETPKPEATAGIKPPNPARALHRRATNPPPVAAAPVAAAVDRPAGQATAEPAAPAAYGVSDLDGLGGGDMDIGGDDGALTQTGSPEPRAIVPIDWPPGDAAAPPAWTPPAAPTASGWRPSAVTIEQIDVLIHEPTPATAPDTGRRDRARAIDARYLRRL